MLIRVRDFALLRMMAAGKMSLYVERDHECPA